MRVSLAAVLLVLLSTTGAAQGAPRLRGWGITLGGDGIRFGGTARDTAVLEGGDISLRPTGRVGIRIGVDRTFGPWRVLLEAGWAEGQAEAANEVVLIRDKTLDLSRYRLAPGLERRLTGLGGGELAAGLAPTLDLWRAGGENRFRWGVEGRLALRVPLGWLALENRLAVGLSGPALNQEDLGDEVERRTLKSLAFGVGLRLPL